MSTSLRFTVVVPTRERSDVLGSCLATLVAQNYADLEILVSDNCSQDETRDVVASFDDPRIRYLNTGRRLNMSDNWEFALNHVAPGWLTILGDDDGLLPGALERTAAIARETGVRAIRSSVCAYQWPSLTGLGHGNLRVPTRKRLEIRDSREWLGRVIEARASYLDLPMLYNGGFVDFSIPTSLREKSGRFYRSCIPDLYMAMAIPSLVERYAYSNQPLAINGASWHSTGTSHFSSASRTADSAVSRFLTEENMPFHADLPLMRDGHYPPSFQALVYESWLQTTDMRTDGPQTDHARQLELILATAGRYRAEMEDWGRRFAFQHALDFERARAVANRTKRRRRLRSMFKKLSRKFGFVEAGSTKEPIEDVFAASLYAAKLMKSHMSSGT